MVFRLAMLGLTSALLISGCRGTVSEDPPVHMNPNMDNQWRFDMQEPNAFFNDGRAMRTQVDGTVSFGTLEATDAATEHLYEGRIGDKWTDQLPEGITLDAATVNRGRDRYQIYCVPCHGSTGRGNGSVTQRGLVAPLSYMSDTLRAYPLGRIVWTLRHGKGNMPSYAAQIPPADRWKIALYVRALQIAQSKTIAQIPADIKNQNGWPLPAPAPEAAAPGGAK